MLFTTLVVATFGVTFVNAHGLPGTPFSNHPAVIERRQREANERHVMARNCAPQVAEYQAQRKARRDLRRRGIVVDGEMDLTKRQNLTPHYSTIQNFTCVGAPEVTEGPYYLRNDLVRQDLTEDQAGTPLYLDIGVLDINTCKPATNVFVEIWACNAQGVYAGFGGSAAQTVAKREALEMLGAGAGVLEERQGPGGGGGGGGGGGKSNADNFLRGGYTTNANGVAELLTIYPGYYTGRTVHIHTMIHQNITVSSNGTIVSDSGGVRHIGQIFFQETINDQVLAQTAYQGSGNQRTLNSGDSILQGANTGGYSAFANIERLGSSLSDGLLGYITIGIDSTAQRRISTTNYYDPNFVARRAPEDVEDED